jgi:type III polyketide synthase
MTARYRYTTDAKMPTSSSTQDGIENQFGDLNLSITGLGVEYPPHLLDSTAVDILCKRHYPESPAYNPLSPSYVPY